MYIEDFERKFLLVLKYHFSLDKLVSKYLNFDPTIAESLITNNSYCNELQKFNEALITEMFGDELSIDVFWYLYEVDHNTSTPNIIELNGVKYEINSIETFMDYIRHGIKLPQKPVV